MIDQRSVFNLRNILIMVGLVLTGTGIIYFATEFIQRLSDWGRVASLGLLAVVLIATGRHFEAADDPTELVDKQGWRWLRIPTAFYALGLLAAFTGVIVFLGMDQIDRLVKAAVVIVAGLAVILVAARNAEAWQS